MDQRPTSGSSLVHADWIAAARAEFERHRSQAGLPRLPADAAVGGVLRIFREAIAERYELGDEISRGGQGLVFRATQRGTRRPVAIKLLRAPLLAEGQQRARFEREAQLLAQLKHPNIVTILDSGAAAGCSYFVMDYIAGAALDEYIREQQPTVREVLALFATICDAVNAAHLRGIVHRDIKPGNIRVDAHGVPHVLDFGLAKASDPDVAPDDTTLVQTATGQFVGSLPWASPEQVDQRESELDIRSDVYSLGVVLFQMLTGSFPYDVQTTIRRVIDHICHHDPASARRLNPEIGDELEQILRKCLQKERERRYQNAGELARELRRLLAGEPIEAKRDSAWYVVRKQLRRHRVAATIGGLVLLLIVNSLVALALFYQQERRLRGEAEAARDKAVKAQFAAEAARAEAERQNELAHGVSEFLNMQILGQVAPDRMGKDVQLRTVLDAASQQVETTGPDDPELRADIHFMLGRTYDELGEYDRAIRHHERSVELYRAALGDDAAEPWIVATFLARALDSAGRLQDEARLLEECYAALRAINGPDDEYTITVLANLGWLHFRLGDAARGIAETRQALAVRERVSGPEHEDTITTLGNLATILANTGHVDESLPLRTRELDACRRKYGEEHPSTLLSLSNLGAAYMTAGRYAEAEEVLLQAKAGRERLLGPDHRSTILTMTTLATLYSKTERLDETERILVDALPRAKASVGPDNPLTISITSNLGWVYAQRGRHAEAAALQAAAVAGARGYLPPEHEYIGLYLTRWGEALLGLGAHDDACARLIEGFAITRKALGPTHKQTVEAAQLVKRAFSTAGRTHEWATWCAEHEWTEPP